MNVFEGVQVSLEGLRSNMLRSLLTVLGVVIGVVAIVLLVSISLGVRREVTGSIESLGSNIFMIFPGNPNSPGRARMVTNRLRVKHALQLAQRSRHNVVVSPMINRIAAVKHGKRVRKATITTGTLPNFPQVRNWRVARGAFFKKSDVDASRRICVIGKTVEEDLFKGAEAVGGELLINGKRFEVVGVMDAKGLLFDIDMDDQVFVPLTTSHKLFGTNEITYIFVQVPEAEEIGASMEEAQKILSKYLDKNDFIVQSQGETLSLLHKVTSILTISLGAIAAISLVVGGIGIMNIMIVSVKERTREIGIRKAVGARSSEILWQFLGEAVVISLLGGVIGVVISYGVAYGISTAYPALNVSVSSLAVLAATGFSFCMGTFFGVYPAYKAASLDPIEALRYE
jgi:putative ABC transport system permease protein